MKVLFIFLFLGFTSVIQAGTSVLAFQCKVIQEEGPYILRIFESAKRNKSDRSSWLYAAWDPSERDKKYPEYEVVNIKKHQIKRTGEKSLIELNSKTFKLTLNFSKPIQVGAMGQGTVRVDFPQIDQPKVFKTVQGEISCEVRDTDWMSNTKVLR